MVDKILKDIMRGIIEEQSKMKMKLSIMDKDIGRLSKENNRLNDILRHQEEKIFGILGMIHGQHKETK